MKELEPRPQRLRQILTTVLVLATVCFSIEAFGDTEPATTVAAPAEADAAPADAAPEPPPVTIEQVRTEGNHVWTVVAAILVFWMQAGFALVESGFTRAKNTGNIMMKNMADMCWGGLAFWIVGYGLMFGESDPYGLYGKTQFLFSGVDIGSDGQAVVNEGQMVFWIFQCVFCATAATIVSGAMAERTNFAAYIIFSIGISAFIYPIYGKWAWGSLAGVGHEGWLNTFKIGEAAFIDFAGSSVVHSIGGWCALSGAIAVGPRIGRYDAVTGKPRLIPGHNLGYGVIGTLILWMGWFGFNAGSTTSIVDSHFARAAVTTMLAACAGGCAGMASSRLMFGKWDIGIACNGVLGGLVGITAGCYNVSPLSAVIIGAVAGAIMPFSIVFFDKLKIDDPVGATSVHLVCGIWGVLAAGIFAEKAFGGVSGLIEGNMDQVLIQLVGIGAAGAWAFPTSFILFKVADALVGLRVSAEVEESGLDVDEHGISCYPSHVVFDAASTHPS